MKEVERIIYLAGGCFWGLEKLMSVIPGVVETTSGYANGIAKDKANYQDVCNGDTGFKEAVKVQYLINEVSLEKILMAYFYVINPAQKNRQGMDVGSQYQTGIYYTNSEDEKIIRKIAAVEAARNDKFFVEIEPLVNFYPAEEYHQKYLDKHPDGYCHIPMEAIALFSKQTIDPAKYTRPTKEIIEKELTEEQFRVTQENGTERPYENQYWDHEGKGIYVDIVSKEPLFSSLDKYASTCGWPAFKAPIEKPMIVEKEDWGHGMFRTEVRSRVGNSHLGHIFTNDFESPNGIRYCINSASLRFIPYEKMEEEGYGYLLSLFE